MATNKDRDQPLNTDVTIRDRMKKQDMDLIKQVHEDLAREEKELKEFFTELKEPVKEDPTLTRKKRYEEKMAAYRQVVEGLDFKNLLKNFWSFVPATPEEIETIENCRRTVKWNIGTHSFGGFALTSFVSYYYRRELPRSAKILGAVVGIFGGGILGVLRSTEYTLKKFEGLGADYDLGRLAITEIEEFRTDKKKKQAI